MKLMPRLMAIYMSEEHNKPKVFSLVQTKIVAIDNTKVIRVMMNVVYFDVYQYI
jgi:hypothetical protein